MYGDTGVIRSLARAMRERADDLRAEAGDVGGRAEAVPWTGLAALAMRQAARDHTSRLRSSATAHDAAADALDRHAREVDRVKGVIADAERSAGRLVDSIGSRVVGALTDVYLPDPA